MRISILCLVLFLISCSDKTWTYPGELERAEDVRNLMRQFPDSFEISKPVAFGVLRSNKDASKEFSGFTYYSDSTGLFLLEYREGIKKGLCTRYSAKGDRSFLGFIKDGLAEGKWTYFGKGGQILSTGEAVLGSNTGLWYYYHSNGKLKLLETWNQGYLHGLRVSFDTLGREIKREYYDYGELSTQPVGDSLLLGSNPEIVLK